jgi:hypothetical protein
MCQNTAGGGCIATSQARMRQARDWAALWFDQLHGTIETWQCTRRQLYSYEKEGEGRVKECVRRKTKKRWAILPSQIVLQSRIETNWYWISTTIQSQSSIQLEYLVVR